MPPTRRNTLRRLVLTLTVSLIAVALVALACGPSAPAGQDDPTPEPTANTEPTAAPTDESSDDNDFPPPTPTLTQLERQYTNLDGNLIQEIEKHEATSGVRGASGSSDRPTPELVPVIIFTDTAERVDDLKSFLEDNGASQILCDKGSSEDVIKGGCAAHVPVSLLRSLAEQPGVLRIDKEYVQQPASNLQSPSSQQTPADAHGATAWRLAGADGWRQGRDNRLRLQRLPYQAAQLDAGGQVLLLRHVRKSG